MRTTHFVLLALSLSTGTAAMAEPASSVDSARHQTSSQHAPVQLSRAEVIADLIIYRKSGLAQLDSTDSPDISSNAYITAQARYRAMRAAPEFAALAATLARERGEMIVAAPHTTRSN